MTLTRPLKNDGYAAVRGLPLPPGEGLEPLMRNTESASRRLPLQADGWTPVSPAKLGSWFLLMMISAVLVSLVHRPEAEPQGRAAQGPAA